MNAPQKSGKNKLIRIATIIFTLSLYKDIVLYIVFIISVTTTITKSREIKNGSLVLYHTIKHVIADNGDHHGVGYRAGIVIPFLLAEGAAKGRMYVVEKYRKLFGGVCHA